MPNVNELNDLSLEVVKLSQYCLQHSYSIVTAESCSGGWVAQQLTAIAGSSAWFDRGFITYSNQAKMDMLGVSAEILATQGAVSEQTALAMALGALARSKAHLSVSVTGIAGPGGGSATKPVGLVWFAWALQGQEIIAHACSHQFTGDRTAIRYQATRVAIQGLIKLLEKKSQKS